MVLPSKNIRTACGESKSLKKFIVLMNSREEKKKREEGQSSVCLIAFYSSSGIFSELGLLG